MAIGSGLSAQIGIAEETYTNEVQRISGTASIPFTLVFEGATTATISVTASAAAVQAALEALPNIGTGGVSATGGALPTAVDITFSGPLVGKRNVGALTVGNGATGLTLTTTTPGTGYGDAVTATRFNQFVSGGLELQSERIESDALGNPVGNQVLRSDRFAINRLGVEGDLEFIPETKGFGLWLAHSLGKAAVITTPGGATLTRRHTHTLGDHWNRSLTVQVGVPKTTSDASNVQAFTNTGCKVTQVEFSQGLDELLRMTVTLDGYDQGTGTALASASFAASTEQFHYGQCLVQIAGANVDARSFNLSIARPLAVERRFLRNTTLKREPILNEMAEITGSIELEFDSLAQYNRFASSTASGSLAAVTVTWATATLIEATFPYRLVFTLPACRFDSATPVVEGPDLVTVEHEFKVLNNGTDEPVTIVYDTTDTSS